jgi:hypothetical protein
VPGMSVLRAHWSAPLALTVIVAVALIAHGGEFGAAAVDTRTLATDIQTGQAAADQHPRGPAAVAYVHGEGDATQLSVRFRAGSGWREPVTVARGARVFSPRVRMVAANRALVLWADATPGGGYDTTIRAALIADDGGTLIAKSTLGPGTTSRPTWIATRGDGTALIAWAQEFVNASGPPLYTLHAARLTAAGFGPAAQVTDAAAVFSAHLTADGTALIASQPPEGELTVLENRSGETGWTEALRSPASSPAAFADDTTDGTVIAWAGTGGPPGSAALPVMSVRRAADGRWTTPRPLDADGTTNGRAPTLLEGGDGPAIAAWDYSAAGYIDNQGRTVLAELRSGRVTGSRVLPGGDPAIGSSEQAATGTPAPADRGAWIVWQGRGIQAAYCPDVLRCGQPGRVVDLGSRERIAHVGVLGRGPRPSVLWVTGDMRGDLVEGVLPTG